MGGDQTGAAWLSSWSLILPTIFVCAPGMTQVGRTGALSRANSELQQARKESPLARKWQIVRQRPKAMPKALAWKLIYPIPRVHLSWLAWLRAKNMGPAGPWLCEVTL